MQLVRVCRLLILLCLLGCGTSDRFALEERNDYFTFFNKDSNYTQGVRLKYGHENTTYLIGQDIYTPSHKRIKEVIPDDRPYAGWLFGSVERACVEPSTSTTTTTGLALGMVGPSALGKQTQRGFHEILGQFKPVGWDNQIHDEPGVIASWRRDHREVQTLLPSLGGAVDVSYWGNLGNVDTSLHLATTSRSRLGPFDTFAGPEVRSVLRNIFLDGNTWRDSHSVGKEYWVAEMSGGLRLNLGRWNITWKLVLSTPEFKSQASSYNYGMVTIGFN